MGKDVAAIRFGEALTWHAPSPVIADVDLVFLRGGND